MKALFLSAPQTFEYRESDPPEAREGWVRVRMRYVGICGSDVHYYATGRIGDQIVKYPYILGHECSGEVLEGAGQFAPGARVYVEPAISCHECDQCRAGREHTCRNLKFLGNPSDRAGCMCEEIVVPPECVVPLPPSVGLDEAVFLEPLCIGVYAVMRSRFEPGQTAAIVGAGPIGLSVLLGLCEMSPLKLLVAEPVEARRNAADALGATATFAPSDSGAAEDVIRASAGGVDVAFECAGTQAAIDDASKMIRPGGTLVLIGIPEGLDRVSYDPHMMRRHEITVVNVRRQNNAIGKALPLLERRRDSAEVLITHRFPPTRAKEAFELVQCRADGVIKALLEF